MPATITLTLHDAESLTVSANIVGDLAIHRQARRLESGEPELGPGWSITHIPSGLKIDTIIPAGTERTKRDTLAFAQRCVNECADDWATVRRYCENGKPVRTNDWQWPENARFCLSRIIHWSRGQTL